MKYILQLVLLLTALGLTLFIYAFFIEPFRLESTFHEVSIGKQGKAILLAHVSDLHSDRLGRLEKKLFAELQKNKADLIVITGDIATPGGNKYGYQALLNEFKAPLGVYFVKGNWEYWTSIDSLSRILMEAGITDLNNKSVQLAEGLWLSGFDDAPAGKPLLALDTRIPREAKIISLFHSPSFFDKVSNAVDLAFAGHSHGGQVRLPFFGALWLPYGTSRYDAGWFKQGRAQMYVSRGLGNSILPVRFNCVPEVAFIKIKY